MLSFENKCANGLPYKFTFVPLSDDGIDLNDVLFLFAHVRYFKRFAPIYLFIHLSFIVKNEMQTVHNIKNIINYHILDQNYQTIQYESSKSSHLKTFSTHLGSIFEKNLKRI